MNKRTPAAATSPTKPATTKTAAAVSVVVGGAPLDVAAEFAALAKSAGGAGGSANNTGGFATFVGAVRGGGGVLAMTLEHYPGMTERALADIARMAKKQWRLTAARISHRVGTMKPGDVIVFVGAAAAHRHAAFAGCRQMTDMLKTRAPFWKKEQTAKGARWVAAKQSDLTAAAKWQA